MSKENYKYYNTHQERAGENDPRVSLQYLRK